MNVSLAAFVGGALAGVAQVAVMGPCTYLVTGAVTGDKSISTMQRINQTWAKNGVRGFYPGGVPIAYRQATNWASREGFTVATRQFLRRTFHNGDEKAKLSVFEEIR